MSSRARRAKQLTLAYIVTSHPVLLGTWPDRQDPMDFIFYYVRIYD